MEQKTIIRREMFSNRIVFIFILSLFLCSSCNNPQRPSTQTYLTITDSYGREITLSKEPERIVSLSPGITEMIFLLKGEDRLVGISDFCNYPPATSGIEKTGGLTNVNIEKLVSLKPDLVLIGSIVSKEVVDKLEKMGITVVAIKEEAKIEGIYNALEELGKIVNRTAAAKEQIAVFKEKLDTVKRESIRNQNTKSVYYVVGFGASGDFTAPANSHIHEIITLAGGRNIGEDLPSWSISREYLFNQNPDIIFVRKEDLQQFRNTVPYNQLKAVKENRIFPIESGWIDIVSPRNIEAIELISSKVME